MMTEEKFKIFILKELFSLLVLNILFIPFPRQYPYEIKLVLTTLVYWLIPKSIDTFISNFKPIVYWILFGLFLVVEILVAKELYGSSVMSYP